LLPHIVLYEAGIAFDPIKIDEYTKATFVEEGRETTLVHLARATVKPCLQSTG
jgi:hypothetical protein